MVRRFLLACSLIVVFGLSVSARETRFVQVAETRFDRTSPERLEKCVEDINTLKKIDFVVFTGDNIASANKENLRGFLKIVRKIKAPVYLVIGDRDVSKSKGLNKKTYREEAFKMLGFGQPLDSNYVFKKNKMVFLVVDGAKEFVPAPSGYYKSETLDWLDTQLKKYKNKKVVLIQHFPIMDNDVAEYSTYKVELYRELLSKHTNVLAIVSGHFNKNLEAYEYGVMNIVTPSYVSSREYKIFDIPETQDFVYTQLREVE